MKKSFLMFLTGTLCFSFALSAQNASCGFIPTKETMETLIENKEYVASHPIQERAITYVPVKFHLIANDAGNGAVRESGALEMLCALNEFYKPLDIQFYVRDGFNYISSTDAATDPQGTTGESLLSVKKVKYMVNMFLVQSFKQPGLLGYYTNGGSYSKDFLVIKKSEVNRTSSTAIHEVGHFLSLPHPFNGWEDNDYDPAIHGNPVNILKSPADENLAIEFVDGSNCETAGDLICDTPASYNFANGYWIGKGCLPMDNSVKDFHGDIVNPDEKNVMDYFDGCDTYHFSAKQASLVIADMNNRKVTFAPKRISCTVTPNLNIVKDTITYISPNPDNIFGNVDQLNDYGDIKLDWNDVPGATGYIVEVDQSSSFTSPTSKYALTNVSEFSAKGLLKNKKYYWHVYPYNEYSTCLGWSTSYQFITGSNLVATNEIKEIDQWSLDPNPASQNGFATINISSVKAFKADVLISDMTGRLVKSINAIQFNEGQQQVELSTTGLTSGMYLIQIKNEDGISTKKLAIQ